MDESVSPELEYARSTRDGIKKKADANKRGATLLLLVVLSATAIAPILILMPLPDVGSKFLPAFLTATAALAAGWSQLRKPQERWIVYRTAQREIEFEIDQYSYGNGHYSNDDTRDSVLADRISKRALQLRFEWVPMVPTSKDITDVQAKH